MRRGGVYRVLGGVAWCVGAGWAMGQGGSTVLRPIEEGTRDVSPLWSPATVRPLDLRAPSGFQGVYEVRREEGWRSAATWRPAALGGGWTRPYEGGSSSGGSGVFARVDGGIYAVFPRSRYLVTDAGIVPEVPPGTVFGIGGVPASIRERVERSGGRSPGSGHAALGARTAPVRPEPAVRSATMSARATPATFGPGADGPASSEAPPTTRTVETSIWSDETYRVKRVSSLIDRAARAGERTE